MRWEFYVILTAKAGKENLQLPIYAQFDGRAGARLVWKDFLDYMIVGYVG